MQTKWGGQVFSSCCRWLIAGDVVLVQQGVPALDLLVLVLQTLIPVLQPLSFGSDTQLTPTCRGKEVRCEKQVVRQVRISF